MDRSNTCDRIFVQFNKMQKAPRRLFNRRNFMITSGLAAASCVSYARYIEPTLLSVTRKTIELPRLPASLDGLVVAQLTDIHYRPGEQDGLIEKAVNVVNAEQPDLIALTGDYVTDSRDVFTPLMHSLSGLQARHGIYAVMGNHDGWQGSPAYYQKGFRGAGIELLKNQGTCLSIKGEKLFVMGTDSVWSGSVDAPACYRGHKDETVLALVHEPDVFDVLSSEFPVDLQLSGHTHGGQCQVPLVGYAPVRVKYGRNYLYGHYRKEDSNIFVSRGMGTVDANVRFACAPEVALLTLKAPKS